MKRLANPFLTRAFPHQSPQGRRLTTEKRSFRLAVLVPTAAAFAGAATLSCASILGIDDGNPLSDAGVVDATVRDAAVPVDANANDANDALDAHADGATVACLGAAPSDTDGVFVAAGGADTPSCGTRSAPCATLTNALARATAEKLDHVYVGPKTYTESILVPSGVTIEGGYDISGTTWGATCNANPSSLVTIQGGASTTFTVGMQSAGTATVQAVTVVGRAVVGAGESVYGVAAFGATTHLVLVDVDVTVPAGGDGASGVAGAEGVAGTGNCPPGSGNAATQAGTDGTDGPAGAFVAAAFVPGDGLKGGDGVAGANGTAPVGDAGCFECGTCQSGLGCSLGNKAESCGGNGAAGCAGGPGGGGGAGKGGGTSVALLVSDATVDVTRGALHAGNGGAGGLGGPGGDGGVGSAGVVGTPAAACTTSCTGGGVVGGCTNVDSTPAGGPAGGRGGAGSNGGRGGDGAGGDSYAIAEFGKAVVNLSSATSVAHGAPGASKGKGPAGAAADTYP